MRRRWRSRRSPCPSSLLVFGIRSPTLAAWRLPPNNVAVRQRHRIDRFPRDGRLPPAGARAIRDGFAPALARRSRRSLWRPAPVLVELVKLMTRRGRDTTRPATARQARSVVPGNRSRTELTRQRHPARYHRASEGEYPQGAFSVSTATARTRATHPGRERPSPPRGRRRLCGGDRSTVGRSSAQRGGACNRAPQRHGHPSALPRAPGAATAWRARPRSKSTWDSSGRSRSATRPRPADGGPRAGGSDRAADRD